MRGTLFPHAYRYNKSFKIPSLQLNLDLHEQLKIMNQEAYLLSEGKYHIFRIFLLGEHLDRDILPKIMEDYYSTKPKDHKDNIFRPCCRFHLNWRIKTGVGKKNILIRTTGHDIQFHMNLQGKENSNYVQMKRYMNYEKHQACFTADKH